MNFLERLSSITKTIMILGNHDLYRSVKNRNLIEYEDYYQELSNINNLELLRDNYFEDKDILVYGLFQEYDYFKKHSKEDIKVLVNEVDKIKLKKSNNCVNSNKVLNKKPTVKAH